MSDNPIQLLTEPASGEDERLAALHAALVTAPRRSPPST